MSIYCKKFLSLYFALETFSHFICGSDNPILVLTDNKNPTRLFQAMTIPPSLWNNVDRVTAFNMVVAHIPGKANAAADFLSRLQSDPIGTIKLKLTDRIPIREVKIDVRAKIRGNTINELFADDYPDELLQVIDITTLITLKQSGNYKQSSQQLKGKTQILNWFNARPTKQLLWSNCQNQWTPIQNLKRRWPNYRINRKNDRSMVDEGEKVDNGWEHTHQNYIIDRSSAKIPQTKAKTAEW